jgi:hypothetical protein
MKIKIKNKTKRKTALVPANQRMELDWLVPTSQKKVRGAHIIMQIEDNF